MKNRDWLKGSGHAMGKNTIQERLAESASSKKKQACRFLGIETPAPEPKLARYAQELDWALADLRSGELTPTIARARGAFFSRSLAQERTRLAAPVPMARAEMERLEGRLAEFATEMEGDDKAPLRAAWTSGAEGAHGGASNLGLHGYWMAQALLRDDAAELDALWEAGGQLGMLRSAKFEPMALAISWGATRCAGTMARAGISTLVKITNISKSAYDAMAARCAGILGSPKFSIALEMAATGTRFYWRPFEDMASGAQRCQGWALRLHLLSASDQGAYPDPRSAFGALGQSFTSEISHGAWSRRADALMEESKALAAWIAVADPEEAAILEAWQLRQELDQVARESASGSIASRNLRI